MLILVKKLKLVLTKGNHGEVTRVTRKYKILKTTMFYKSFRVASGKEHETYLFN